MICGMTYDTSNLAKLGREHKKHRAALDRIRPELAAEVIAAHEAGLLQKEIADLSGYTREIVRQMCLTEEQREAERLKRRQRTRKAE